MGPSTPVAAVSKLFLVSSLPYRGKNVPSSEQKPCHPWPAVYISNSRAVEKRVMRMSPENRTPRLARIRFSGRVPDEGALVTSGPTAL
jgi:hypothetical protein